MSDSSWRDHCYAEDLGQVLFVFDEIQKRQPLPNSLLRGHSFDGRPILDLHRYQPSTFMKSRHSSNPTESHTPVSTSSTFHTSPDSSENNKNVTTIAPNRTQLSSPVELSSPTSSDSCPMCNFSFNDTRKHDQRSNLNRHIRTTHASHKLACPEPDCDRTYKRSDNVIRHRRNDHGAVINAYSRSPTKERKFADTKT